MASQKPPSADDPRVDPIPASQIRMQDMRQELWSATESESSLDRIWGNEPQGNKGQQVMEAAAPPASEQRSAASGSLTPASSSYWTTEDNNVWTDEPGSANTARNNGPVEPVPAALQPGLGRRETNPFKRKPAGSAAVSQTASPAPSGITAPSDPPASSFSQLRLADNEPSNNPWRPALDNTPELAPSQLHVTAPDQPGGIWDSAQHSGQPSPAPGSASPALISIPSEDDDTAGWEEAGLKKASSPALHPSPSKGVVVDDAHWDDLGPSGKGKAAAKPAAAPGGGSTAPIDDWNLVDIEAVPPPPGPPPSKQDTWENFVDPGDEAQKPQDAQPSGSGQKASPPPSHVPAEASASKSPRPVTDRATENYLIKNITWHDVRATQNPRTSPILVQNANGPCPLVALVNALTLTTPADTKTGLVDTLRSREQISLDFLINAVFDELMSPARSRPDSSLPDVGDLYAFLKGLHTGMNVNPRFVPTPEVVTAFKRTSLTHLHPTERADAIPGSFEDTREMSLYGTFSIPLIHGWLPAKSEPAHGALTRRAASYEDAQNLLFREEELDEKLSSPFGDGLTEEEQAIYQDILTIKSFLHLSATQLTPWGIDVIRRALTPGSVAILFRNDHFSTLYRHPDTLELLTLVTDAGYAGHADVVWESLVDVNGEHAEFFSGDFRLVGGASHQSRSDNRQAPGGGRPAAAENRSSGAGDGDWTTVQGRRGRNQQPREEEEQRDSGEPPATRDEQEDRDLALALQLQEEEDERHRAALARRQRESRLSEQFIEQQGRPPSGAGRGGGGDRGVAIQHRQSSSTGTLGAGNGSQGRGGGGSQRGRGGAGGGVRSLLPPRNPGVSRPTDGSAQDAPPSYEHAAKQTPYLPPEGHPSHPASSPDRRSSTVSASASASSASASGPPRPSPQPLINSAGRAPNNNSGRMRPGLPASNSGRERDCIIM